MRSLGALVRVLGMRFAWLASSIASSLALGLAAAPAAADEPAPPAPATEPAAAPAAEPTTTAVVVEPESMHSDVYSVSGAAGVELSYEDRRSYAKNWLVAPPGWTFGGQMKFITANTSLFGADQRTHLGIPLDTRAEPDGLRLGGDGVDKLLVDVLLHQHPAAGGTDLALVDEGAE